MSSFPFLLISFALLGVSLAQYPLYIDELEEIVFGPDKRLLDILGDDDYTSRSKIKEKFEKILARQSDSTKTLYAEAVEEMEKQRHRFEEIKRNSFHLDDRSIYDEMRSIMADLSLSKSQAARKYKALWHRIVFNERERLQLLDSDSHSSEDFDFD